MTTIRIEHRDTPKCFNATSTDHWRPIANELKKWREAMGWEIKAARVKPLTGPVTIKVHHLRSKPYPLVDCGAIYVAAKASVDALVDLGILPGDGPEVVTQLTYLAPEVVGYHGLALEITEIETAVEAVA